MRVRIRILVLGATVTATTQKMNGCGVRVTCFNFKVLEEMNGCGVRVTCFNFKVFEEIIIN